MALLGQLGDDFRISENRILLFADLEWLTAVAWEDNLVTGFQRHLDDLSVLVLGPWTNSDDGSFGLFPVSLRRQKNARGGLQKE